MRKVMTVLTAALVSVSMVGEGSARGQDSLRSAKRSPVSFRLASMTPVTGFEQMTLSRDKTVYVAPKASLAGSEVTSVETIQARRGTDVALALTNEAAERFGNLLRRYGVDHLAVFVGGRLVAAGPVAFDAREHQATISGLSSTQVQRITHLLSGGAVVPGGPAMTLVPSQSTLQAGGALTMDLFVSGVADLRVYQAQVEATGGTRGSLVVEDLSINSERADYVFGTQQKLDAVDQVGGRMGAVLFAGGVDATSSKYLGTFTLRASDDALGTFSVNLRGGESSSILWTSQNQPVRFGLGPAATISVGTPSHLDTSGK